MKKNLLLLAMLLGLSAQAQQKIEIRLMEENKKVVLNNDFKVFLMVLDSTGNDQIVECAVTKNVVEIPVLGNASLTAVIFQHEHSSCRIPVKKLNLAQTMRWEFGVDRKPYAREYRMEQANHMDTEAMFTLGVQPLQGGGKEEFSLAVNSVKGERKEVSALTKNAMKSQLIARQ